MHMSYDRDASAGYLTNLAGRLFTRALERRLEGGTAGPMPVFFGLAGGKARTQKQLAGEAAVEQPTMANTLARMERDGLVLRTPDPDDRRSALVRLTPLGEARAEAAFRAAKELNRLATSALSPDEQRHFYDMMRRIIGVLEGEG